MPLIGVNTNKALGAEISERTQAADVKTNAEDPQREQNLDRRHNH
jgi:hypothetical protein